jgi:hypothetical protein
MGENLSLLGRAGDWKKSATGHVFSVAAQKRLFRS